MLLLQVRELGNRRDARAAPCRPEVNDHNLALGILKPHALREDNFLTQRHGHGFALEVARVEVALWVVARPGSIGVCLRLDRGRLVLLRAERAVRLFGFS